VDEQDKAAVEKQLLGLIDLIVGKACD